MQKAHFSNREDNFISFEIPAPTEDVLIFKTNIQTQGDKFYIKPFLDQHPLINQWNIDLEDVDCVLRIVSIHLELQDIIDIVVKRGYECQELI